MRLTRHGPEGQQENQKERLGMEMENGRWDLKLPDCKRECWICHWILRHASYLLTKR